MVCSGSVNPCSAATWPPSVRRLVRQLRLWIHSLGRRGGGDGPRAQAVTRFTIVGDDHVNCAVGSECRRARYNRREPDRIVALSQQIMNLLRASEVVAPSTASRQLRFAAWYSDDRSLNSVPDWVRMVPWRAGLGA